MSHAHTETDPLSWKDTPPDDCPHCGASMLGEPIEEEDLGWFGHHRRELHVETGDYDDGAVYLVCPDCHGGWPVFQGTGPLANLSAQAVALHEESRAALADPETVRAHLTTHAEALTFAVAINGYGWTGWSVDPRDGATLYLLLDEIAMSEERIQQAMRAQSLATDILGYPTVRLIADGGWVARDLGLVPEPVPSSTI